MYNNDLKAKFMAMDFMNDVKRSKFRWVFEQSEQFEEKFGCDIHEMSIDMLKDMLANTFGNTSGTKQSALFLIKEYLLWCVCNDIDVNIDLSSIKLSILEELPLNVIKSPAHLQRCLDMMYKPESDGTVDNVWRCCCWLLYGGAKIDELRDISETDVDLVRMIVRHKGTELPIYREAVPAFTNAVRLKSFKRFRTINSRPTIIDRASGSVLIRTKNVPSKKIISNAISTPANEIYKAGKLDLIITSCNLNMFGLFYRLYERQCMGVEPDFYGSAELVSDCKTRPAVVSKALLLKRDYHRWLQAVKESF